MARTSARQRKTSGRVMPEFAHGELKRGRRMMRMIVPMLVERFSSVVREQDQQSDDRQWHARQPQQQASSHSHVVLPGVSGDKAYGEDERSVVPEVGAEVCRGAATAGDGCQRLVLDNDEQSSEAAPCGRHLEVVLQLIDRLRMEAVVQ